MASVKQKYDKVAPYYDYMSGIFERHIINHAVSLLNISKKDKFLDLACGTGKVLKQASKQTNKLYGCDFSKNMVEVAKKRCPTAKYKVCNITNKLYYDKMDKINLSVTLGMIPKNKQQQMFKEIKKILKSNGLLVVTEYTTKNQNWFTKILNLQNKVIPSFQDCKPLDVEKILKENKFKIIKSEIKSILGFNFEIVLCKK